MTILLPIATTVTVEKLHHRAQLLARTVAKHLQEVCICRDRLVQPSIRTKHTNLIGFTLTLC